MAVQKRQSSNNNADLTADNSQWFKYKAALVGKTADAVNNANSSVKNTKFFVPIMYLSNIWRSLQIPLINCKIYLGSKWIEGESVKFKITDAKIHVPIITLSTKKQRKSDKSIK